MPSQSNVTLTDRELADYGVARVRDLAFDAVQSLWRRRTAEGMKQKDVAAAIGRDPAWVSRNLRGPGNWTLRTIGELIEALNGEVDIRVHAVEDPLPTSQNFDAYLGYGSVHIAAPMSLSSSAGTMVIQVQSPAGQHVEVKTAT